MMREAFTEGFFFEQYSIYKSHILRETQGYDCFFERRELVSMQLSVLMSNAYDLNVIYYI